MLYAVSIPDGKVTVLDSLDVLASHDFSWSPDGRWLAFTRPTELDRMGEYPVAADLWIADTETGNTWPLLEGPEWVESDPLWITARSIQVNRRDRDGDELGAEQVVVIEIAGEKEKAPQHTD
jgi:Tol biopolymer transport system component